MLLPVWLHAISLALLHFPWSRDVEEVPRQVLLYSSKTAVLSNNYQFLPEPENIPSTYNNYRERLSHN